MKIWLGLVFADGDIAAALLAVRPSRWSYAFVALLYPFYIKSEVQLIYVQLNVNDKRAHVAMLQLTIMKHIYLLCWIMRSRRGGPSMITKAGGYNLGTMTN